MSAAAVDAALDRVAELLAGAQRVLLTSHRRPDGDGTGSMVGLASLLRGAGKEAVLYSPDLIPRRYKWLPLLKSLIHKVPSTARFDVTVIVDCADLHMVADALPPPEVRGTLVSLDHHAAGHPFGDITVCDPGAAAVSVIVARLARRLGWSLAPDAATALYVSLISDTGGFRHANTNVEAMQLAAELVAAGAQPAAIASRLEERSTPGKLRLLGAALSSIDVVCNGKVALLTVTADMVETTGGHWDDIEGFVYWARGIEGVLVGVLLTTARGGGVRVSMRARDNRLDVGAVCLGLGGGGHPGAAGCHLDTDLIGARQVVIEALGAALVPPAAPPVVAS
jgi:bifunctional oligoribonuclease and PAP phosphatase NrnA